MAITLTVLIATGNPTNDRIYAETQACSSGTTCAVCNRGRRKSSRMRSSRAVETTATLSHFAYTGSDVAEAVIQRLVAPEFRQAARIDDTFDLVSAKPFLQPAGRRPGSRHRAAAR
jgi:hypothetical protein